MKPDHLIQAQYDNLTKSERKVADFVLSQGNKIIYATMTEIKEATGVGDATIIRFCQKLGFNGFSDFKIELAKEDYTQQATKRPSAYYDEIANYISTALDATAQLIEPTKIDQTVSLMQQAKHIYLFGVGSSGEVATSFAGILLRVGVQATAVSDPHFQAQVASLLTADDVVFGFSLSGRTKDTFDALRVAKENGATIIAVTNYLTTPIGKMADVVLQSAMQELFNGGSVAGRVSQLYICDVITRNYENKNQVDAVALRERVLRAVIDKSID
ncbi:MurR/RpiR family transcriptional regulator [Lacticaseibacillus brantae]|uniref:RpiR family phosphosugar-binding transcriptional regulator n=1 Tax=Lacticaseibacillus brantae DSM 23927 TaxID=1423727 RepID=A0A0R2AXT1_9LACO|nr:MurR/RpiR family transcriptional regulator [Lacticaseibacillus brantae]KRM72157.1 RpiR family phosphosugar-binding transcriptional regulator [Lacticaseibacillus brantae DSM 23927]